jgi:predicted DNA binding CopG/RHH family protein
MMTNVRGEKQDNSLVLRVSNTDKVNIQREAQRRGVTMSTLIKSLLIDAKVIDPVNPVEYQY